MENWAKMSERIKHYDQTLFRKNLLSQLDMNFTSPKI